MTAPSDDRAQARGRALVEVFHWPADDFGELLPIAAEHLPKSARTLLDHTSHMTVAMERFHCGPVGLRVVQRTDGLDGTYAREILLHLADGRVVQHGIVRIDLGRLPPDVAAAIRDESAPLGRILLDAGLLCDVHDVQLLSIVTGPWLAKLFDAPSGAETFGRVARIGLAGQPVIELLEIIAPAAA